MSAFFRKMEHLSTSTPLEAAAPVDCEPRHKRQRPFWVACAITLTLVFGVANFKLLVGAHAPVWDADGLFAPAYTLVADHARACRILLWNPWRSGGTPEYADPQFGSTSPVMVILGAITGGTDAGFRIYYILFWLWGGFGMLLLARHLNVPPWGALVVASGFLFSGFYTGHAQHTSTLYAFSWVPFMLWRLDLALHSRRLWPAVQAGGLWGLSSLGGYPQNTIITGGFLLLWILGWYFFAEQDRADLPTWSARLVSQTRAARLRFAALALLAFTAVGTLILSPGYVAFFVEGHGYSDRVGPRSREEAVTSMPTPFGAWSTFSSPYLTDADTWVSPKLWPTTDATFTDVYMGVLTPVLALFALLSRPRSKWRWWLVAIIVFFIACSVGDQLPLRGWLYDYVPPTRYWRNPGWFREYAMLCVSILALLGLSDIPAALEDRDIGIWSRMVVASAVTASLAVIVYLHFTARVKLQTPMFHFANSCVGALWGAGIVASLVGLFPKWRRALPLIFVVLAICDALLTFQISGRMVSSNGSGWATWKKIDASHNRSLMLQDLNRMAVFDPFHDTYWHNKNVPMRVATFKNDDTLRNRFQMDFWGHPLLMGMSTGKERMWFVTEVATAPPTSESYKAFVKRTEELKAPVLVVHPPQQMNEIREQEHGYPTETEVMRAITKLPAGERVPVKLLRYSPNHLDFNVSTPAAGWLLVTDRWAHGWAAKLNGKPVEVFGGDFIFRAIRVTAGDNKVEFSYRPAGFPALLILSWGTLLIISLAPLCSFLFSWRRYDNARVELRGDERWKSTAL